MESRNLADLDHLPPVEWSTITSRLDAGFTQAHPRCSLSLATEQFDLVVEGEAPLVTDPPIVARLAAKAADDGWPARVDESGTAITADFSAPSAGPPPWHVYRIIAHTATALATVEPGGATRWRF